MLFEFGWSPKSPTIVTDIIPSQQEAITSQQPDSITSLQPAAITHQPDQQDLRADALMTKTLFAADVLMLNKEFAEKKVSLDLYDAYFDNPSMDIDP
jgi:hypothetical protein